MPTEHHYTRQTTNGKPASGHAGPSGSAHSARPQGNFAHTHSYEKTQSRGNGYTQRSGNSQNPPVSKGSSGAYSYDTRYQNNNSGTQPQPVKNAAGGSASYARNAGYQPAYASGSKSVPKKKPFSLKRFWKKIRKKLFVVEEVSAKNGYSYQPKARPASGKPIGKKAKQTAVSALRAMARGVYLFVRRVYNYLMKLPPRTLLAASSAFGLVVLTVIILAIALPGKHASADAQQQLAAFADGETQTAAFDSGTIDVYENSAAAPETDAATAEIATDATTVEATQQTETQTSAAAFTEELREGDDGEIIAAIQTRLMELGYMDSDEPTQHFGPLTQSALVAFQRHNGLDDDGICGQSTYEMLLQENAKIYVMQLGDSGPDVEGVQQRLYELGYLDNKANIQGTFGEKTEEAVKAFQKKNDLTSDGKVGDHTLEMLYGEDVVSNAYRLGDKNQVIEDCQTALKKLGYITFKPDGEMGKATVSAIKAFQQANGLTRDGALGPVTRDMILSGDAQEMVLQLGDYGTNVKNVQTRLVKLNYLASANATGYYGEITEDAVKAFQKRSGLTQDGKIGAVTLTMLNSSSAKKSTTSPSTSKETKSSSSSFSFLAISSSRVSSIFV